MIARPIFLTKAPSLSITSKISSPATVAVSFSSIFALILRFPVVIKSDQVRHLHVPQYETLTVALLYAEMVKIPEVLTFLPDPKEVKKLPK